MFGRHDGELHVGLREFSFGKNREKGGAKS
jgi:hypothetical protein